MEIKIYKKQQSKKISRGKELSLINKNNFDYTCPILIWSFGFKFPFSSALSKNAIWRFNGKGHIFNRAESNSMRQMITFLVKNQIQKNNIKIIQNKLWVDIFVEKNNMRSDAINVIDLICDGIKDAIDIDDRWFSIKRLDWSVVKNDPHVYVTIGQESIIPVQVCSYCGRLLSYENFRKLSKAKNGIGRECRECCNSKTTTRKTLALKC